MHRARFTTAAAVAVACAAVAASASAATAAKPPPKDVSIMFLVRAEGATVTSLGEATYRIRLTGTSPTVYGFTDRPARMANHATMLRLARFWTHSDFVANPPNGSLVMTDADGADTTVVATLTNPRWNKRARVFTLDARLLRDIASGGYSAYTAAGAGALPGSYRQAKLFIDSAPILSERQTATLHGLQFKATEATCPEGYRAYTGYWSATGDVDVDQASWAWKPRSVDMYFRNNTRDDVTITWAAYCVPNP